MLYFHCVKKKVVINYSKSLERLAHRTFILYNFIWMFDALFLYSVLKFNIIKGQNGFLDFF